MWRLWAAWPSPDSRGYLIVSIGAYWVASFVSVYLIGAVALLVTFLVSQDWPLWALISAGMFLWSLPFFFPGLVLLFIGLRMAKT